MHDIPVDGIPFNNSFTVKNMFSLSLRVALDEAVAPNPSENDCGVVMLAAPGNAVVAFRKTELSATPGVSELFSTIMRFKVTCAAHLFTNQSRSRDGGGGGAV